MNNEKIPLIQEISWQEAREQVRTVDKTLADLIDNINPNKNYKLLKVIYSFGDLILKDGVLQLPKDNKQLISINDPELDKKIKEKLNYNAIPLFLTLHNSNEVFIDTGTRIIPLNFFNPGSLLGTFESADFIFNRPSQAKWSVSAGARSIFMLPKINESSGFKRLRMHYRLPSNMKLQHLSDHWHLFRAIANHSSFDQAWHNEILFFSREWLMDHEGDSAWGKFHRYILGHAWEQAKFAITKIELGVLWEPFVEAVSSRRLKPTPYLADHVKHIMPIAMARWPGFRPVDTTQLTAPTMGLQQAMIDIYQLKQYFPTIMHCCLLNHYADLPVYYSLAFPTLLEGSPYNRDSSTIMLNLRDLKLLLEILVESFGANEKFGHSDFKNIKFEYFHVEPDKYAEIQSSRLIPENDPTLLQESVQYPDRIFCATSPFWRGCIRISPFGKNHK